MGTKRIKSAAMTDHHLHRTDPPDLDAPAGRKRLAEPGRTHLSRFERIGAACDVVPPAETGLKAEVR
ncbi:hypothetical protein [Rhodobacteraceae bacterium DSL-40]|uniref:hypothetical protein n=1 Tax=Amaricoccus sp. B4 TaxID=3368557 RepID=UPI000DAD5CCB